MKIARNFTHKLVALMLSGILPIDVRAAGNSAAGKIYLFIDLQTINELGLRANVVPMFFKR